MCRSAAFFTIVMFAAGCTGGGRSKSEESLAGAATVDQEFQAAMDQLTLVVDGLTIIVKAPGADLASRLAQFESDLGDLDSKVRALRDRGLAMNARRDEYLDYWIAHTAKLQNVDPKTWGEQHRAQLVADLIEVNAKGQVVRSAYALLQADLHDSQRFLARHPNASGAQALTVELEQIRQTKFRIDEAGRQFRAAVRTLLDRLGIPAESKK